MPDQREFDAVARQRAEFCMTSADSNECVAAFAGNLPLTMPGWSQSDADALAADALRIIAFIRGRGTP